MDIESVDVQAPFYPLLYVQINWLNAVEISIVYIHCVLQSL